MFTHRHYVPILKTKAGDRWAIAHLQQHTKSQITPLFEIHKHKTLDVTIHAAEICEGLASVWGTDSPLFLDGIWLHKDSGDPAILTAIFDAARRAGIQAVPVARVTFNAATQAALRRIVQRDRRGYLLRVTRPESHEANNISAIVQTIALPYRSIHLMIDYRSSVMHLATDLPRVPHINQWQTITAAAGVFPRSLSTYSSGTWYQIERGDWISWLHDQTQTQLPRRPAFGDYTMRDPGPPADFGSPSVNLRYAKSPHWLVRIGGKVNAGASGQMHRVCQSLIGRPDFDGAQFSAGDQAIEFTAMGGPGTNGPGPGGPTQWLQWCMNHHIEFTAHDIRNQPGL